MLRIGADAFEGCTGLTSVYVEEGYLAMVVYDAFRGCTHLSKVDLPSTLRVLDMDIFDGCSSLDSIIIRSVVPPTSRPVGMRGQKFFSTLGSGIGPCAFTLWMLLQSDRAKNFCHIGQL